MSSKITIVTFDWVPSFARGYVRDIRVRWLCEETDRDYDVETVPVMEKTPGHFAMQPFGQVPIIKDGDLTLFESGAILMHLAEGTPLLPKGRDGALVAQWLFAAMNSIEPYEMSWIGAKIFDKDDAAAARFETKLRSRLKLLQDNLGDRQWLASDDFTIADLMMASVLRSSAENGLLDDLHQLASFLERATARPAFGRAMADHMAHWRAADERRAAAKAG